MLDVVIIRSFGHRFLAAKPCGPGETIASGREVGPIACRRVPIESPPKSEDSSHRSRRFHYSDF
jgi:hypothetical protein